MKLTVSLVTVAACCAAAFSAWAQPLPPAPPKPGYPILVDFSYADDSAARKAWAPMNDETAGVSVVPIDGARNTLRMPCNFVGTTMERASWDHTRSLDLASRQGVRFRFYCPDPSPVSRFSLYFRSGPGWYSASFSPTNPRGWSTVTVKKDDMTVEGAAAGWATIDRIRIAAWRAADRDTAFYIADFGVVGADAPIVVVRGEYAARQRPKEAKTISDYAQGVGQAFDELGVPHVTMSDLDVSAARLRGKKVVILPYNPVVSDAVVDTLAAFVRNGGKLIVFYTLPKKLYPVVGVKPHQFIPQEYDGHFASIRPSAQGLVGMPPAVGQRSWNVGALMPIEGRGHVAAWWHNDKGVSTGAPAIVVCDNGIHMSHVLLSDDIANKRQMLLAMVAHFVPECARQSALWYVDRIGVVGPYARFDEAERAIRKLARRDESRHWLDQATQLHTQAATLVKNRKYFEAIAATSGARDLMVRAYCAVQTPQPGEHRAFWCHDAFGVAGMRWDEAIKILADNGFTAVLPNMLWGGVAFYESDVLPVAKEIREEHDGVARGDQIVECLAACKKYGVECHVWKVNWNMGWRTPKTFVEKMKSAGRTQVTFKGVSQERWLCPSHPDNQRLEIDAMVEVATKYDVDGIHFDYIRYPDPDACFCVGCRARFEKVLGKKVSGWPQDVRNSPVLEAKWLDFRRRQIDTVVAGVHAQVRKAKPGLEISAAVFQNWPSHRDTIAQDWKMWCDKGYLDFVCPMDYVAFPLSFRNLVEQQLEWAGNVPCYPGIGLSVWPNPTDVPGLIEFIRITRELQTGGFTIFNYGESEAKDVVPLCGLGITRH